MTSMATAPSSPSSILVQDQRCLLPRYPFLRANSLFHPSLRNRSSSSVQHRLIVRAVVAADREMQTQSEEGFVVDLFACPVCYEPLVRKGPSEFNLPAIYRSGFKCKKCNKTYSSKNIYLDLTVTAGAKNYNESRPARTELFRSPLVSFLYERGWRQNFNRSGFPGPDEEFQMAQEYFKPAEGDVLVDVSCGSGLFSRMFAKSGAYAKESCSC